MDRLNFVSVKHSIGDMLHIYINDKNLIDLIREIELESDRNYAGYYAGILKSAALLPSKYLLGEKLLSPNMYFDNICQSYGAYSLLTCQCGIIQCNGIGAKMSFEEKSITWSDFFKNSNHQLTPYPTLGPFQFDRKQYLEALAQEVI